MNMHMTILFEMILHWLVGILCCNSYIVTESITVILFTFVKDIYIFFLQFFTTDDGKLLNGPVVELVHLDSTTLVCSVFHNHSPGTFSSGL